MSNDNSQVDQTTGATLEAVKGGALYCPIHVQREVKIYPITEEEFFSINDLNLQVQIWSGLGMFFLAFFSGCAWDAFNAEEIAKSSIAIIAVTFVLMIGCFSIMAFHYSRRDARIQRITEQTKVASLR